MSENRRKTKLDKKKLRRTIIIIVLVIIVAVVGVIFLQNKVKEQYGSSSSSDVLTASVSRGSISATVSGSGTLENEAAEEVEIPSEIELDEIHVEKGDIVKENDLIATVNISSVISAMSDKQDELDELDTQLEDAAKDTVDSKIKSKVSGRIKEIYAEKGDDVTSVINKNGALMILSLDGYMAVDVETTVLSEGDSVTITTSDEKNYEGTVDKVSDGIATILVTDNATENGDTVSIKDADDNNIGTGELYIHQPLKITGYAGTISSINVTNNQKISASTSLITLTDTSYTANYESILKEREEIEKDLQKLMVIYKEGAVYAPIAGTIESITDEDTESETTDEASTYITICPNNTVTVSVNIDESDILSLEEGQTANVTIDSIGDDVYSGTITKIKTSANSSNGVTQYTAIITIDKTEKMLSGMSASITITIDSAENVLIIPKDALKTTSSTSYVYTSYDESTGELSGMVEVTSGLSNSSNVEILTGLNEGDVVYYTKSTSNSGMAFVMPNGGGNFGGGNFRGDSGMTFTTEGNMGGMPAFSGDRGR